jgi:hypothetical protein
MFSRLFWAGARVSPEKENILGGGHGDAGSGARASPWFFF